MPVSRTIEPREDVPGGTLLIAADAAAALLRVRLAEAGAALALPAAIDDESRARAGLLIEGVVAGLETALRDAEPLLDAAPRHDLPTRFVAAGLLTGSGLAAAALLRAEEHRLAAALVRVTGDDAAADGPGARRLDPIGGALAAESFAVRAAEAARIDRIGDPLLPLHDIPAEDRHAIAWQVAACLADATLATQGAARAGNEDATHRAAAAAVARCLAAIDDGDGIARAAMRLAQGLEATAQLDDALAAGTLAAGRIASFAAMLAVRAGIGFDDARAMLTAPARAALLLRACAIDRAVAAPMILALALALDTGFGPEPAALAADLVAAFDRLPPEAARAAVRRVRLDPHYRDALAALA